MPIGEQPSIEYHAGTDAGAERENEKVVDAASGAGAPLGIAGEPAVIVGAYRHVPPSPQGWPRLVMSMDAGSVVGSGCGGGGGCELPDAGPGDDVEPPLHAATSMMRASDFMGRR